MILDLVHRAFRPTPTRSASVLGRLGGRASAEAKRAPIRAQTRLMREQMGMSEAEALR